MNKKSEDLYKQYYSLSQYAMKLKLEKKVIESKVKFDQANKVLIQIKKLNT